MMTVRRSASTVSLSGFPLRPLFRQEKRSMRLRSVFVYALGLTCAASVIACGGGGGQETSSIPAAAPGAVKVDPATAGDIKGTVTLEGMAPKNDIIKMNADPVCLKQTKGEQ